MKSFTKTIQYLLFPMTICAFISFAYSCSSTVSNVEKESGGFRISDAKLNEIRDSTARCSINDNPIILDFWINDPFIVVQAKLLIYKQKHIKFTDTYEFEDERLRGDEWTFSCTYLNDSLKEVNVYRFMQEYEVSETKEAIKELISAKYGAYYRTSKRSTTEACYSTYYWFKGALEISLSSSDGYSGNKMVSLKYSIPVSYSGYRSYQLNIRSGIKTSDIFFYTIPYYNEHVKPELDSILRKSATDL